MFQKTLENAIAIMAEWICPKCGAEDFSRFCGICRFKQTMIKNILLCSLLLISLFGGLGGCRIDPPDFDLQNGNEAYEKKDYVEALKWYQKAAHGGNDDAQYCLGLMYEEGKGVKQDYAEAMKFYKKDVGDSRTLFKIGLMYEKGLGVKKDSAEALIWYQEAEHKAEGDLLSKIKARERAIENSPGKSLTPIPYGGAGDKYTEDRGLLYDLHIDPVGYHLQKANEAYEKKDYMESLKWYQKAAQEGDRDAQYRLGLMYEEGKGVKQDYAEAMKLYKEDGAYSRTLFKIGLMYEKGLGVKKDSAEALIWYQEAEYRAEGDLLSKIKARERAIENSPGKSLTPIPYGGAGDKYTGSLITDWRKFKDCGEVEHELREHLPMGSRLELVRHFCEAQGLSYTEPSWGLKTNAFARWGLFSNAYWEIWFEFSEGKLKAIGVTFGSGK